VAGRKAAPAPTSAHPDCRRTRSIAHRFARHFDCSSTRRASLDLGPDAISNEIRALRLLRGNRRRAHFVPAVPDTGGHARRLVIVCHGSPVPMPIVRAGVGGEASRDARIRSDLFGGVVWRTSGRRTAPRRTSRDRGGRRGRQAAAQGRPPLVAVERPPQATQRGTTANRHARRRGDASNQSFPGPIEIVARAASMNCRNAPGCQKRRRFQGRW
jgi:hypothetical protein